MKSLTEIVDILTKSGYLNVELKGSIIAGVNILPLGRIFIDNIRREWLHSKEKINSYLLPVSGGIASNERLEVNFIDILKSNKFREDFLYVKNNFQKELPFAIKEETFFDNNLPADPSTSIATILRGKYLTTNYFFNETSADEHFYKIQRERKIWWMKFSANPGRYFLTDLKSDIVRNHKVQSVKISSKFEFGNLELETIQLVPLKSLDLENPQQFMLKDTRIDRKVTPAVIQSEFCLETGVLALLFDSVEGENKTRKISIHRKISPYQCSMFCLSEDEKILLELEELAMHLGHVIRKSGITVLNLRKCYLNNEKALQKEIRNMDNIGVPYSIILEQSSLKDGLMKLRSRDTGISETIHITDVPHYLVKIVNT